MLQWFLEILRVEASERQNVTDSPRRSDDRLRLTRLARGLSQGDLAQAAGVTRQAISGIESGRWSPSLDVALALAQVLDSTVEDLFGTPGDPSPVRGRLAVSPRHASEEPTKSRLLLAEVAGDTVVFPLTGDHAMVTGFVPALATAPLPGSAFRANGTAGELGQSGAVNGAAKGGRQRARKSSVEAHRIATSVPTLAVAGCDPALALLLGPLQRHDPPVNLAWWSTCNERALELLEVGAVHAASVHGSAERRTRPRPGIEVVGFAAWREGLAFHPRHRGKVKDLRDIVRAKLRIANREHGAEARHLLEAEMKRLKIDSGSLIGFDTEANGHLLAASAIAAGLVDAAVVTEPAALAYGLEFIPWQEEVSELYIPRTLLGSTEVRALLDVLAGRELPAQLAALEGYDAECCGRIPAA